MPSSGDVPSVQITAGCSSGVVRRYHHEERNQSTNDANASPKSKHKRKSRSKNKSKRSHYSRVEYSNEPWDVAGSSRDYYLGRPRSVTGSNDPYFSYQYVHRPFYEFVDDYDERSYRPSRKSSASKRSSYDCVAGEPRTGLGQGNIGYS
ncbi:hypothetical protein MTO96_003463 [Rhipicephalus appendiculatus]